MRIRGARKLDFRSRDRWGQHVAGAHSSPQPIPAQPNPQRGQLDQSVGMEDDEPLHQSRLTGGRQPVVEDDEVLRTAGRVQGFLSCTVLETRVGRWSPARWRVVRITDRETPPRRTGVAARGQYTQHPGFSTPPERSGCLPADGAVCRTAGWWRCWHDPAIPAPGRCRRCGRGRWWPPWRAGNARRSRALRR